MGAGPTAPRGQYIVMPTASARTAAWSLCENRRREYQLLRRHAFKLIHWPTGNEEAGQQACDIDWDWIKSLEEKRVGELRIDEHINGHNNVRVIFFKANKPIPGETLCRIWLLAVFQKITATIHQHRAPSFQGHERPDCEPPVRRRPTSLGSIILRFRGEDSHVNHHHPQ